MFELGAVIVVIGVLVGLLLPAIQAAREATRRMSCSNNLSQIVQAVHQYHDAFDQLPRHGTGTSNAANDPATTNQYRLSMLVGILPHVGQPTLWDAIVAGSPGTEGWPPMGGSPAAKPKSSRGSMNPGSPGPSWPLTVEVPTYRCPSDPGTGLPAYGRTNYTACLGDAIDTTHQGWWRHDAAASRWVDDRRDRVNASCRGAFIPRRPTSMENITDGLSNTMVLGEIVTYLGDRDIRGVPSLGNGWSPGVLDDPTMCRTAIDAERPRFWSLGVTLPPSPAMGRGYRWADMAPLVTGFNAVAAPNTSLCFGGDAMTTGAVPASSQHPGGCHVAMGDGSVCFVSDSIDTFTVDAIGTDPVTGGMAMDFGTVVAGGVGWRAPGSPSAFGVWGAMATRAGGEIDQSQY